MLAGLALSGATLTAIAPQAEAAVVPCLGRTPTIVATADGERLQGTDGPDVISIVGFDRVQVDGNGGDDVVCVTAWTSADVRGGPGADTLVDLVGPKEGLEEPTRLYGGPEADHLVGAQYGRTVATFADAPAGVTIRLGDRTAVDGGDTDTLDGIRSVVGSDFRDTFVGSAGDDRYTSTDNYFVETDGDVIRTGAGDDQVWAFFSTVDLGPGDDVGYGEESSLRGGSGDDKLDARRSGSARGGSGDDLLTSATDLDFDGPTPVSGRLLGGPGDDRFSVPHAFEQGDSDCPRMCARGRLDGGAGTDRLELFGPGAVADLASGRVRVQGGRSTLRSIENVSGTRYADVIRGSARANRLVGGRGNDVLLGRGGADTLIGDRGRDRADGGPGRDRCVAEVRTSC